VIKNRLLVVEVRHKDCQEGNRTPIRESSKGDRRRKHTWGGGLENTRLFDQLLIVLRVQGNVTKIVRNETSYP
jgi:hypothetical protein